MVSFNDIFYIILIILLLIIIYKLCFQSEGNDDDEPRNQYLDRGTTSDTRITLSGSLGSSVRDPEPKRERHSV